MNKKCEECGGTGKIRTGPNDWKVCACAFWSKFKAKVGPEIALALPAVEDTPLLVLGKAGEPVVTDRTDKNVFIKAWWSDLLHHLQFVLLMKNLDRGLQFYHQVVTDERLKGVYLGAEAYSSRSKKRREDVVTFNTLADLVGVDYHLVIIRLGFLGYKNIAMPGILKEALLIRQAANLPTWIVEEPNSPFGPGHFTFNEDVFDYISSRFEVLDLTKKREGDIPLRGVAGAPAPISEDHGMSVDDETARATTRQQIPVSKLVAKSPKMEESTLESDNRLFGSSKSAKKKPMKRRNGDDE